MDENSCENETSESADGQKEKETEEAPQLENVGIRLNLGRKQTEERDASHGLDDSGPSTVFPPICDDGSPNSGEVLVPQRFVKPISIADNAPEWTDSGASVAGCTQQPEQTAECSETVQSPDISAQVDDNSTLPGYEERQESQHRVRLAPSVKEQLAMRRPSLGPPPSYSFVMKQKKKLKPVPSLDPLVTNTPPPPSYTGSRGAFVSPEEQMCNFPSFADPIWRSHSQPALCPRCGIIVLTTTHTHDSIATHVASLALCLFGCWPCCLIPYCMNVCKNTYHHCPICQTFLGLYKPW